jgi:type II secretory pathway pseudopilin PulG
VKRREGGYSLVALVVSVTIMLVLMTAAAPTWRYIMKNDREEELLFRGGEIADSIVRFQKKNGNAFPTSLDQLVKGRFLRKLYKDPMSTDGKWRLVHQGEPVPGVTAPGSTPRGTGVGSLASPSPSPSPSPTARPGGVATGPTIGPIIGVASTSKEKSLRVFNGKSSYNEWIFAAGQPRVVGKPVTIGPGASVGGPGQPTPPPAPTPIPAPTPQ